MKARWEGGEYLKSVPLGCSQQSYKPCKRSTTKTFDKEKIHQIKSMTYWHSHQGFTKMFEFVNIKVLMSLLLEFHWNFLQYQLSTIVS